MRSLLNRTSTLLFTLVMLILFSAPLSLPATAAETKGECGENAFYTLSDDGVLTISGSGAINASSFIENTDIRQVVICEGITEIGTQAFINCANMVKLTIPASVERIAQYSFRNCTSLVIINYEGLKEPSSIANAAFSGCTVQEVYVPIGYNDQYFAGFPVKTYQEPELHVCSPQKVAAKDSTCITTGIMEHYQCTDTDCGKIYRDSEGTDEITDNNSIIIPTNDSHKNLNAFYESGDSSLFEENRAELNDDGETATVDLFCSDCKNESVQTVPVKNIRIETSASCTQQGSAICEVQLLTINGYVGKNPTGIFYVTTDIAPDQHTQAIAYRNDGDTHKEYYPCCQDPDMSQDRSHNYNASNRKCPCGAVEVFTITWIVDGAVYATTQQIYGEQVVFPEKPFKEGHDFENWYYCINDEFYTPIHSDSVFNYTIDVKAEARFSAEVYTVTWIVAGKIFKTEDLAHGSRLSAPNHSGKVGDCTSYEIVGWSMSEDGNAIDLPETVTESATYYALLTYTTHHTFDRMASNEVVKPADCLNAAIYRVKCDNCDAISETKTVENGNPLGHDWGETDYNWSVDNTSCTATRTCSRGCTETAEANISNEISVKGTCKVNEIITYTANFNASWAKEQKKSVEGSTNPDIHESKSVTYTVNGDTHSAVHDCCGTFYIANEAHSYDQSSNTCICGDIRKFAVILDGSITGGKVFTDKTAAAMGETVTVIPSNDEGYELVSVTVADENGTHLELDGYSFTMPASNVTVIAVFKEMQKIPSYTVTWIVDGVERDETYELGATPSFTGSAFKTADGCTSYIFAGWSDEEDGNIISSLPNVTANTVYYAVFVPVTNHGNYEYHSLGNGEHSVLCANCHTYQHTESCTVDDNTHKCIYCASDEVCVIIFMNGDEEWSFAACSYGSALEIGSLTIPTKEAHTFTGWYTADGTKVYNGMTVTCDLIAYAVWEKIPASYSVAVSDKIVNGSVTASAVSAKEGDTVTLNTIPAKGYKLSSLTVTTDGGDDVTVIDGRFIMPSDNVTVSAEFKPVRPASALIQFFGTATLEGRKLADGEFTFLLMNSIGDILDTAVNNENGDFFFTPIEFNSVGTYTFYVCEDTGTELGITYDESIYKIIVTITDNGTGTLVAEVRGAHFIGFINTYINPETAPDEETTDEPEVTEPEITKPEITEPEITEPEVTEPEVTKPEVTEPEITEPASPETGDSSDIIISIGAIIIAFCVAAGALFAKRHDND